MIKRRFSIDLLSIFKLPSLLKNYPYNHKAHKPTCLNIILSIIHLVSFFLPIRSLQLIVYAYCVCVKLSAIKILFFTDIEDEERRIFKPMKKKMKCKKYANFLSV